MARVHVEAEIKDHDRPGEAALCIQKVTYLYDDGNSEKGFRFIWRRNDGSLMAARGQARIPSLKMAEKLLQEAQNKWTDL